MPVYNCAPYVRDAISSILNQSYSDFELFIIDDASEDETVNIINSFTDTRISIIQKYNNTGYTDSLNIGIKMANGDLIARMDGDDISDSTRFEMQVAEFNKNPELALCGSWIKIIDSKYVFKYPTSHNAIKVEFLSYCCIAHPTVMFRKSFIELNNLSYNKAFEPAEDYDLWTRIVSTGNILNIPKVLLQYREYENQTSQSRQAFREKNSMIIKIRHLAEIISNAAAAKFYSIEKIISVKNIKTEIAFLKWLESETYYIKERNYVISYFNPEYLSDFLQRHLRNNLRIVFLNSKKYNPMKLFFLIKYIKAYPKTFSYAEIIKGCIKCSMFYSLR